MARLSDYRTKRDFAKTAEPRGRVSRAAMHRFVIQRHDATRLHYDLRLELDGVYKSWAVTKVPSLDPAVKRLAVEVEDHPLDYGTFEGTIPESEYGGGTVQLWDRGLWLPQGRDAAPRALGEGHLKFVLNGERMKGGWALVRMKDAPKKPGRKLRHNWLLIKEKDDYARPGKPDALAKAKTSVKTGRTLEEIAVRAKPGKTKTGRENLEIAGLVISHPDKILWPAAKPDPAFTKRDLAAHYEAFAERILVHVAGRPISMLRAPDGIEGQKFFQRHANKQRIHARPVKIKGETEPYVAIDDLEGLISLAQAAVLEIHPWGSKKNEPEVPERVIIDLDPAPDIDFGSVIAAAKEMGERFRACGLEPFVKTTGGKGLHVVAAIKGGARRRAEWKDVKEFAHRICLAMERDNPDAFITTMAKKARTGKIFLDYLRNDRTSTAVAPWSPRARPHAPIATPLEWRQLRKGLDPLAFTLLTARDLLKRADPWADLHRSAGSLDAAMKKLERGR